MCARDSGIDYGCQISGLKALPACATPPYPSVPVGGARQRHLCCVLALSTRFRRSLRPPPHTHMPRGAILCRQLPEILHASSIRIIVAIVAHIELQMCVCGREWARGEEGSLRTRRNNNAATAKNEMLQRSARFLLRVLKRIAYLCV